MVGSPWSCSSGVLPARHREEQGGRDLRSLVGLAVLAWAGAVAAAEPPSIRLELNRLETVEAGCRVYLVVGNDGAQPLQSLKLDLVLFGSDGVIDRRLALEAGPLRPAKTTVKLFDVTELPCQGLGSILVNDVLACREAAGADLDCFPGLRVATRTSAGFTK